jgi:16S rRNA (cytosine967-C5)-methyltransferase
MISSAEIRAQAAQYVAQVVSGRSLDALPDIEGTPQERGLLRALIYDSVRWYIRLDALLGKLLTRPQQRLEPEVRALAIVGLCQLLYTEIPQHAAVAETVNAARVLGRPRAAGLLNALLRRCQRESDALLAAIDEELWLRTAHPRWLVDAIRTEFPKSYLAVLDANNARPPFWIRVNRLRVSGAAYRERLANEGLDVAASMFDDETLLLKRAVEVNALPGFNEGLVSVQDAAAQLAARFVAPRPGERILDACAAPGGKTCHLLELEPELAELVAIDVSAVRLERVQQNLSRLGLSARLIAGDAEQPSAWWDGKLFDRILLDVPCSSTGVIRRHPDIKLLRRKQDIPTLATRQARLLRNLWPLLAPGGRLVYASCSALRAENAAVVDAFLHEDTSIRDITRDACRELAIEAPDEVGYRIAAGTAAGQEARMVRAHGSAGAAAGQEARMVRAHGSAGAAEMDGFYYACLEKTKG